LSGYSVIFPQLTYNPLAQDKHIPHCTFYTSHSTSFSSTQVLKINYKYLPLILPVKKVSLSCRSSWEQTLRLQLPRCRNTPVLRRDRAWFCSNSRSLEHEHLSACLWHHYERHTICSYHLLQPSKHGELGVERDPALLPVEEQITSWQSYK